LELELMSKFKLKCGGKYCTSTDVDAYLDQDDIARENANIPWGPNGLLTAVGGSQLKNDYLSRLIEAGHEELVAMHETGIVHIHDLSLGHVSPYCSGHSLRKILEEGIETVQVAAGPAKRFNTASNQAVNFIGSASNEFAGAQAFSDIDVYFAPYAYEQEKHYLNWGDSPETARKHLLFDIQEGIQNFIFHLNWNTRYGGQCVRKEAKCHTPNGWKGHDELQVGDEITVFDYNKREFKLDTLKRISNFAAPEIMLHIETDEGTHIVTKNHKVLVHHFSITGDKDIVELVEANILYMDIRMSPCTYRLFTRDNISGELRLIRINSIVVQTNYDQVWCPTTDTGTFICKEPEGCTFITGNSPFSNITLALDIPKDLKNDCALINGERCDKSYGELREYQQMIAEAVLNVFIQGDKKGTGFTFPVLTLAYTKDFFDNPLCNKVCELTGKYGTPYFQNYVNGESGGVKLDPADVRSMCCRLQIQLSDIKKSGGLFGNGEQTGSLIVVTISLPALAAWAKGDVKEFNKKLLYVMRLIKNAHLWKRDVVNEYYRRKFHYTAYKHLGERGFKSFFTTFGFIGLWEAVQIVTGNEDSFLNKEGMELAMDILQSMVTTAKHYAADTETLMNVEATPAESTCYKLAKKLRKNFPGAPTQGTEEAPYLTNSTHIPVYYNHRLDLNLFTQSKLQAIVNGGTVFHYYLGEQLSIDGVKAVLKTLGLTKLPYFSISPVYTICECCGNVIPGYMEYCPHEHTDEQVRAYKKKYPHLVVDGEA